MNKNRRVYMKVFVGRKLTFVAVRYLHSLLLIVYLYLHSLYPPSRWSGPPGPGFWLHLRDGVSHQSCERVPQPAARGPQRAAHEEKHAAGDKVSLMGRLIRFCSLTVFTGRHRIYNTCAAYGEIPVVMRSHPVTGCCWIMKMKECKDQRSGPWCTCNA